MTTIAMREFGSGTPILLLHGTPSPAADWLPVAMRLAEKYRVLLPELPGYGASPPPGDATFERVDDQLAAALDARGVRHLRAIAGFSSGAYRALDLVIRRKVGCELVISLGGVASFDQEARDMRRGFARAIEANPAFLHSADARQAVRDLMLGPDPSEDAKQRVDTWSDSTTAAALVAELDALASIRDLRPELPRVTQRLYLRVGAADRACPPALSEEIAERVPGSVLEIVPSCGHALLLEDLAGTTSAIEQQLERR